jgi:hypothetical protein
VDVFSKSWVALWEKQIKDEQYSICASVLHFFPLWQAPWNHIPANTEDVLYYLFLQ